MSSSEKENLKELVRIDKFRINLLQEAFNTMLFLETQHSSESDSDQKSEKKFHKLILPGLRFTTDHDFENMWFDDCLLNEMEIYDCRLKNVKFENSKLKDAIFQHVQFENCKMSRCEINGTDFEFQSPKELGNLLVGNKYRPNKPPNVPPGTRLSTPVDEDSEFMTAGEARQALNHEYDINGPDDSVPKFIIYRGPDDRPENVGD